jgi:quinol monooxygenase YgiN
MKIFAKEKAMKKNAFFGVLSFVLMSKALVAEESISCKPHTVIVILEAKQGKENLLREALIQVAQLSSLEESCIEYRFYQDNETPTRFALYEEWESKELHQKQFSKPYILSFAKQAEPWLDKPCDAIFGQEISLE